MRWRRHRCSFDSEKCRRAHISYRTPVPTSALRRRPLGGAGAATRRSRRQRARHRQAQARPRSKVRVQLERPIHRLRSLSVGLATRHMVVFVNLLRASIERHGPSIVGDAIGPIVRVARQYEREVWKLSALLLTSPQQEELRELIASWLAANAERGASEAVRFDEFASELKGMESRKASGLLSQIRKATAHRGPGARACRADDLLLPTRTGHLANARADGVLRNHIAAGDAGNSRRQQ